MRGRVAVLGKPHGPIEIQTHTVPDPKGDGIVLKVEYTGICGTDIHIYNNDERGQQFPAVLGHEVTGRIVSLGKDRKTDSLGKTIKEGDRIVIVPSVACGKCYFCRCLGKPVLCSQMGSYGGAVAGGEFFCGGFADYMHLGLPGSPVFKVELDPKIAVLTEPLTMGIHTAEVGDVSIGDTVVVLGVGTIGLASVLASRLAGASAIYAVDIGNSERLRIAQILGAEKGFLRDKCDFNEILDTVRQSSAHGLGADIVINSTGMPANTLNEGLKLLRNGGTYVDVGSFSDTGASTLNFSSEVLRRGIRLLCVPDTGDRYFVKAIAALVGEGNKFHTAVSHEYGLTDLAEILPKLANKEALDGRQPVKVLINPSK